MLCYIQRQNLAALMFGGGDYAVDVDCAIDFDALMMARMKIVQAAALKKLASYDTPYFDFIDGKRYREDFGFYFEDFEEGLIIEHRPGRTITRTDNTWMTLLTMNTAQLHFDAHYAENTEWKLPLVDSTLTLAIITGMTVNTISKKVVANLEWDKVKLLKPIFEGDTIYAESEIISKRESNSRPNQGIVTVETRGIKQTGEVFMSFLRTVLVYKRGHAPDYNIS